MPQRFVLLLCLALAAPAIAQNPESLRDDYARLQQWRFRAEPIAVPAGGLKWTVEGATWTFDSGRIWLEEPTSGGAVTGLVFEGKGRFQMAVPDEGELVQLRRFARRPDLAGLDEPFSALVLRTSGELPLDRDALPPAGSSVEVKFVVNKLALERHEHWLTQRFFDADSRIIQALATPGERYLRADMKTDGLGWLTWDYDGQRLEEIRVESFNASFPAVEVWLSLDRAAERDERGRPTSRWHRETGPEIDIQHVDVAVDLTQPGREKDWAKGRFKVGLRFTQQRDGGRAVQLYLDNFADVKSVSEGGRALPFLRDHIGGRRRGLDNRIYDASLMVLLDQPLAKGAERRLDLEYEMDVKNYAPGRSWYPSADGDETILPDPHTARLEITVRKKFEVRAVGRREEGSGADDGRTSTSVWIVDQPAKMLTFSFSDRFHEERLQLAGVPDVICFGSKVEVSGKGKFREVGQDVIDSLGWYQQLFDARLPETPIYVTSIDARHGQAFDGFIQLAEQSFDILGPGSGELFRAHEAGHQFWGVLVGAASYRDAWLGEAFAEYSGMMFVQATMKNGQGIFDEILRAYNDELNGSIKSGFSKFSRMNVNLLNRSYGDRIGPIGHGWRANTGEVPSAYSSQVYAKGALVLHMLRGLLRDETGGDQAFTDVLSDFVRTHRGGLASTQDFEAAVARHAPGDWSWFFDEWVRGTSIPAYRWSHTVASSPDAEGKYVVHLKVRQADVPAGFKMSVPVAVELAGGKTERRRVMVDEAEETFTLAFTEKPKRLAFNPDSEVLAKIRRE
ncbi:MAG TPA: M1 family aminopeptidase [Thermoanaerobaculia bacterium]|nr:M1 family aminopeptidase [Thermoanaerobaculia bacterium]